MKFIDGDLTETPLKYIAHGCNLSGVFNKGVAKAVRTKWPDCYDVYMKYYKTSTLGEFVGYWNFTDEEKIIGNLFTQQTYGNSGKHASYFYVLQALSNFIEYYSDAKEIAIPRIGCSLGGLDWNIMEVLLCELEALKGVEFHVYHKED